MRSHHPLFEPPPACTGDLDADTAATIRSLFAHEERWLLDDAAEATTTGSDAA